MPQSSYDTLVSFFFSFCQARKQSISPTETIEYVPPPFESGARGGGGPYDDRGAQFVSIAISNVYNTRSVGFLESKGAGLAMVLVKVNEAITI